MVSSETTERESVGSRPSGVLPVVVRVRLRIECGERSLDLSALANSGYESETPQLLVPIPVAQLLGLWPPREYFSESVFETAGGPLRVWIAPRVCKSAVLAEGAESPEVEVDLAISPIADEVLLSDKTIGELQIALEDVGKGLWRFRWEPSSKLRRSEPPKYWK